MGNDLNDPGGAVALEIPEAFEPGEVYDVTVRLTRPLLERGGFQLSARIAKGPGAGSNAGTLRAAGTAVQLVKSPDGRIIYAEHTRESTRASEPGSLVWSVRWIAPKEPVTVRFDLAANASNDDDSPFDDFIYTASRELRMKN
jgi:hypothetical protein